MTNTNASTEESALYKAVAKNDINKIKELLKNRAIVDEEDDATGETALYRAVRANNIEAISILLEHKANINKENRTGKTPLHIAIIEDKSDAIKILLNNGADVNKADMIGTTPLHVAARAGKLDTIKMLLFNGADVNKADDAGVTVLDWAIRKNELTAVGDLLCYVAKPNENSNILHWVARRGTAAIATILSAERFKIDINKKDEHGYTPLHWATIHNNLAMAQALSKYKGVDVNSKDILGNTPLHLFTSVTWQAKKDMYTFANELKLSKEDSTRLLSRLLGQIYISPTIKLGQFLLQNGANVNAQNQDGNTPLHLAAMNVHEGLVEYLITKKADANAQNQDGNTPLHLAAQHGHASGIEILLKKGANINANNKNKSTPLHLTTMKKDCNSGLQILLKYHAKIDIQDTWGNIPLHLSSEHGNIEAVDLLLGNLSLLRLKKEKTYKIVNAKNYKENTSLCLAVQNGHTKVVKTLLLNGANNTLKCEHGKLPSEIAKEKGYNEITELLLQAKQNNPSWKASYRNSERKKL